MSKRLSSNIVQWDKIGVTQEVRDWIINGVPVEFNGERPKPFHFSNPTFKKAEFDFIQSQVSKLLKDGAIKKLDYRPDYVSKIKCVPKKQNIYQKVKSDPFRLIIDLSFFNTQVKTPKFQYDGFAKVARIIEKDDYFTSFDCSM